MRSQLIRVIGLAGIALTLAACGDSDEDAALAMAATACTNALADAEAGQGDADVVNVRTDAADEAAKAANLDPRWDGLVDAATGWEQGTRQLMEMTIDLDSLNEVTMAQMADDLAESERQIQSECRKVRAAGGDVPNLDNLTD